MLKILTAIGAAALAASALAAPAAAAAADEPTTVAVKFADLDLSKPADAKRLLMRLRIAAREVCGTADPRDARIAELVEICQAQAMARAEVQLANLSGGSRTLALGTN